MPGKIITGARVVCYINGLFFGRVFGFSWESFTPQKEIFGLDQTEAFELADTTARCSFQIQLYRTAGDGGAQGAGVSNQYPDLSRSKYFTVVLVDRGSNTVIFQANSCKTERESWNVPLKNFVTGQLECKALDWTNEVMPAAP